jgi:hypothetical protein
MFTIASDSAQERGNKKEKEGRMRERWRGERVGGRWAERKEERRRNEGGGCNETKKHRRGVRKRQLSPQQQSQALTVLLTMDHAPGS